MVEEAMFYPMRLTTGATMSLIIVGSIGILIVFGSIGLLSVLGVY